MASALLGLLGGASLQSVALGAIGSAVSGGGQAGLTSGLGAASAGAGGGGGGGQLGAGGAPSAPSPLLDLGELARSISREDLKATPAPNEGGIAPAELGIQSQIGDTAGNLQASSLASESAQLGQVGDESPLVSSFEQPSGPPGVQFNQNVVPDANSSVKGKDPGDSVGIKILQGIEGAVALIHGRPIPFLQRRANQQAKQGNLLSSFAEGLDLASSVSLQAAALPPAKRDEFLAGQESAFFESSGIDPTSSTGKLFSKSIRRGAPAFGGLGIGKLSEIATSIGAPGVGVAAAAFAGDRDAFASALDEPPFLAAVDSLVDRQNRPDILKNGPAAVEAAREVLTNRQGELGSLGLPSADLDPDNMTLSTFQAVQQFIPKINEEGKAQRFGADFLKTLKRDEDLQRRIGLATTGEQEARSKTDLAIEAEERKRPGAAATARAKKEATLDLQAGENWILSDSSSVISFDKGRHFKGPNGEDIPMPHNAVKIERRATGKLGDITGVQKPEVAAYREQEIGTREFVALVDRTMPLIRNAEAALGGVGAAFGAINTLVQQAEGIVDLVGGSYQIGEGPDATPSTAEEVRKTVEDNLTSEGFFDRIQGNTQQRGRITSVMVGLAFSAAAAAGSKGRAVSDKDVERWMTRIGQNADPEVMAVVLQDIKRDLVSNLGIRFDVLSGADPEAFKGIRGPVDLFEALPQQKSRFSTMTLEDLHAVPPDVMDNLNELDNAAFIQRARDFGVSGF